VGSVQISWFHAKLKALSQSSSVSAEALLKQFEKKTVRRFISLNRSVPISMFLVSEIAVGSVTGSL
jgi:hypothetical protein